MKSNLILRRSFNILINNEKKLWSGSIGTSHFPSLTESSSNFNSNPLSSFFTPVTYNPSTTFTDINEKDISLKSYKDKELVSYNSSLLFLGSCFSENISSILSDLKFNVEKNPYGILFSPLSISKCLNDMIVLESLNNKENNNIDYEKLFSIFYHPIKKNYYSYNLHSSLTSSNKEDLINKIKSNLESSINKLKSFDYIFLTLGTSKQYYLKESDEPVANCHQCKLIYLIIISIIFNYYFICYKYLIIFFIQNYYHLMKLFPLYNLLLKN